MFALLALGVRLGAEFVDVEGCWDLMARQKLVLNLRTTTSQKCAAVPRRARVKGVYHTTLGWRVIKKKKKLDVEGCWDLFARQKLVRQL